MDLKISKQWDGSEPNELLSSRYNVRLEILRGDLRFIIDAPFFDDVPVPEELPGRCPGLYKYECVEIFISSGDASFQGRERETPYLEIEVGPHGHYYMLSFLGEQLWESQDDELSFEESPEIVIDRSNKRWRAKGSIPFYLLPEPGSDMADPLKLVWKINCVAIHGQSPNREFLSQNILPSCNFHQLGYFSHFVLSDRDSQRLRSMSRSYSTNIHGPRVETRTFEQVVAEIYTKNRETEKLQKQNDKFQSLVRSSLSEGEGILLSGVFWKRKGWSHKHRLLVLTSKARLLYFSTHSPYEYKGCIAWSMTKPVAASLEAEDRFDIVLHDGSRRYHFYDEKEGGKEIHRWISSIIQINEVQKAYMQQNIHTTSLSSRVNEVRAGVPNSAHGAPLCILL